MSALVRQQLHRIMLRRGWRGRGEAVRLVVEMAAVRALVGTVDRGGESSSGLAVAMSAAALVVAGREVARAAVKTAAAARARGCGVAGRDGVMWSGAEQGVPDPSQAASAHPFAVLCMVIL